MVPVLKTGLRGDCDVMKGASEAGRGNCMVRRQIASRIVVVVVWSAQMYPACLWRQAPGHNGVRASLVGCPGDSISADSVLGISVGPAEGACRFLVSADVAVELS